MEKKNVHVHDLVRENNSKLLFTISGFLYFKISKNNFIKQMSNTLFVFKEQVQKTGI